MVSSRAGWMVSGARGWDGGLTYNDIWVGDFFRLGG